MSEKTVNMSVGFLLLVSGVGTGLSGENVKSASEPLLSIIGEGYLISKADLPIEKESSDLSKSNNNSVEQNPRANQNILMEGNFTNIRDGKISEDMSSLRLVHLLYRHGDRTPCHPYPTDPYKDPSYWPAGFGQLTSIGKMMHFRLGQWLRQRYSGFLSPSYDFRQIKVRSTDVDRTLMSALSNLAGLYPPSGYWEWNKDLDWQPIPVHTVPKDQDNLLIGGAPNCPRQSHLLKQLQESDEIQRLIRDNIDLFQYISEKSGVEIKNLFDIDHIYDTLFVQSVYNLTLPSWTESIFPGGRFGRLRDISFLLNTYTPEMKRLCGGPFVNRLTSDWDKVVAESLEHQEKKVFMFSGHDSTISMVLNTLGVYNGIPPPYASLVMFELHRLKAKMTSGDPWSVRLLYRNTTTSPPFPLRLPGCGDPCPLQTFKKLTESVRPTDWVKECHVSSEMSSTKLVGSVGVEEGSDYSAMLYMVVLLSLITTFVTVFYLSRPQRRSLYQRM